MIPWPATSIEQTISWLLAPSSGSWKARSAASRATGGVFAEDVQRVREALEQRALDLAMVGEHDQALARGAEVVDPGERRVELAAGGEQLQRVQPHQAFGAQRRRDLRVELVQVQRLALQPRDEVALGEAVLGLVVELDRHDARGSSPAAAAARRPSAAARSSARAGASAGAGARRAPRKRLPNCAPEPKSAKPPEDPQLGDQLGRAVHHGRARQREHEPVARHRRRQLLQPPGCASRPRSCSSGTRRAPGRGGRWPAARGRRPATMS